MASTQGMTKKENKRSASAPPDIIDPTTSKPKPKRPRPHPLQLKYSSKFTLDAPNASQPTAYLTPKSSLATASSYTTAQTSVHGSDHEQEGIANARNPERRKITRYQKKRKQEFKMVKKNKPELTDEQAWSVVQAVDQAGSLQGENERDMLVWTSETDSEWDEERIRRERNLAGAGGS